MILRSSPSSPFGRKVRIAISVLGLDNDVKIEAADTTDVNDSVRKQNPLGKIPVVIAEDGTAYYDSRVILDYLDDRAGGGKIVPRDAMPQVLPHVGQITLACTLGYRDFRFNGTWRGDHPRLVAWLDQFAARVPAFAATKPAG
jgi:glutathione S-transferase